MSDELETVTFDVTYTAFVTTTIELPDGKSWDDVDEWFIKWNILNVFYKDETQSEHELDLYNDEVDTKRPESVNVYKGHWPDLSELLETRDV